MAVVNYNQLLQDNSVSIGKVSPFPVHNETILQAVFGSRQLWQ